MHTRVTRTQRAEWTRERIDALSTAEVRQLRENAARLNEAGIAALCDEVLVDRPKKKAARRKA